VLPPLPLPGRQPLPAAEAEEAEAAEEATAAAAVAATAAVGVAVAAEPVSRQRSPPRHSKSSGAAADAAL